MDIEGFEVDVFEDFSCCYFKNHKPILVFEIHPTFYEKRNDLTYILDILDAYCYEYRKINGNIVCFPY
ncbi:hypothetical protein ES703_96080 [subsurface metagenome]